MANQGQGELLPNHADDDVQAQAGSHRDHRQYHILDAARALMLLGAAAAVFTLCNCNPDAAWVLLAFVTWLLGVCLLSLVPLLAGRFPEGDRLAGAAIAGVVAVFKRFFIPWN